jgi:hypothetical protein
MEKKQTAVDLMFKRAISVLPMGSIDARRKLAETYLEAKQIEKEQIENAYWDGGQDVPMISKQCEQYYNETYGETKN